MFLKHNIDAYTGGAEQGFIDDAASFLTRRQAAVHAWECGQLPNDRVCPEVVISEDLW